MVPVTPLGGEHDAGGTVPRVAGVVRGMVAGARAGARRAAGGGARAAPHRREQHLRAALARQLLEDWNITLCSVPLTKCVDTWLQYWETSKYDVTVATVCDVHEPL